MSTAWVPMSMTWVPMSPTHRKIACRANACQNRWQSPPGVCLVNSNTSMLVEFAALGPVWNLCIFGKLNALARAGFDDAPPHFLPKNM
mmetsp:Transcript_98245/g.315824  ORF Transcript_98245/g.315824 Transcript_98245/m.315824 type:complete len:88 (-) Transcript_98245:75-338(-)